ncbi:carboxypeptidase-like regulatory domain-containing protein [Algoriphagus sp. NG3]|uniref:carboxypeptidase-like regulatory domain-containing protein n=1 Tax=Algoriphagus sp. NG3 TaxID=3097546 RepID=UPI002A7EA5CE|nr:carboxypeptidase-like regulatory domain-containing protein [Algoriphagus sp. NG3]WPR77902.1 carboxypeptidase-like regulatory domain-containing protein [Algoriphagus sp. NG3]
MIKILSLLVFVMLLHQTAFAQVISGKIKDENNHILPYVNIGIINEDKGTISSKTGQFTIDITELDDEVIVRYSLIGFENMELTLKELKSLDKPELTIILKSIPIDLDQIDVSGSKGSPVRLGSQKAGKFSWIWSNAIKGDEIGMLFRVENPFYLDKFSFHIKRNTCDSIYYRIRIYDGKEELPVKTINQEDIRFMSKLKKGWETIDISRYNILIESDFIITMETLDSSCSEIYNPSRISMSDEVGLSYSRPSSMAEWLELGNQMSFRIEGVEILDD